MPEDKVMNEFQRKNMMAIAVEIEIPGRFIHHPLLGRGGDWSEEQQSALIESLLVNIPVPPIVLCATAEGLEVVDGQQRLLAIQAFYTGKLKLRDLRLLRELNGCTIHSMPLRSRDKLDFRTIEFITMYFYNSASTKDRQAIKRAAFENLN